MKTSRVFGMLLSLTALVMQVVMLFVGPKADFLFKFLSIVIAIFAALLSFVYFFKGGTKSEAKWRTLFCMMLAISLLFSFIKNIQAGQGTVNNVCLLLTAILTGYLAFVKDLGKNKSIALAIIVVILQIITIVFMFLSGKGIRPSKLLGVFSTTILILLLLSTTYTKYIDKELRKAK